jgi:hypothetical protein
MCCCISAVSALLNQCSPLVSGLLWHVLTFLETRAFFNGSKLLTVLTSTFSSFTQDFSNNLNGLLGALSPGVKRLGHEADHSPPSSAKNGGAIPQLPHASSLHSA